MSFDLDTVGVIAGTSYHMTNAFLGPSVFLHYEQTLNSVYGSSDSSDAAKLSLTVNLTGSTNTWNGLNTYTLCTGPYSAMQMCLGVGPVSRQLVTLYPRSAAGVLNPPYLRWTSYRAYPDNFLLRLENDLTGEGWYLDTYSDTFQTYMGQGNLTGQYWSFRPLGNLPEEVTSSVSEPATISSGVLIESTTAMSTSTHAASTTTSTAADTMTVNTERGNTPASSTQATPTATPSSGTRFRVHGSLIMVLSALLLHCLGSGIDYSPGA